ncbi:hypothetical protein ZHAS_00020077 [Anopheles sinensis]|uniref:Uncharacterized protein n=1 Tax=Anopheles sinensis TaxID=74873 RepID=A0A084WNU2_ANOSI|nr:hypothetical protein ZHAS_00020077 [Anopheles sinensis]
MIENQLIGGGTRVLFVEPQPFVHPLSPTVCSSTSHTRQQYYQIVIAIVIGTIRKPNRPTESVHGTSHRRRATPPRGVGFTIPIEFQFVPFRVSRECPSVCVAFPGGALFSIGKRRKSGPSGHCLLAACQIPSREPNGDPFIYSTCNSD